MFHNIIKHNNVTCQKSFFSVFIRCLCVQFNQHHFNLKAAAGFVAYFFPSDTKSMRWVSVDFFSLSWCCFTEKIAFIKNCSRDCILNHTRIFQLSPLARWLLDQSPNLMSSMFPVRWLGIVNSTHPKPNVSLPYNKLPLSFEISELILVPLFL